VQSCNCCGELSPTCSILFEPAWCSHNFSNLSDSRVNQSCEVGGKMSDSDLYNISDSDTDSNLSKISDTDSVTWMRFDSNGNRLVEQEFCFNKSLKRNCTISTGTSYDYSNSWVRCKKWFNWTSGVRLRHRLHPKTSDFVYLWHRLRNPGVNMIGNANFLFCHRWCCYGRWLIF